MTHNGPSSSLRRASASGWQIGHANGKMRRTTAIEFLIGLLASICELLTLLPQIMVGGAIRRFAVRKGFWVAPHSGP